MQRASRAWKLAVSLKDLPGESADDDREDDLHGDVSIDAEIEEATDGVAGDWANFVPEDFATADDTTATVMNIPRLALPGTVADPVGLSLDASINGTGDVDVFWLGALSPNWRLELKVVGGATQLALFRSGSVRPGSVAGCRRPVVRLPGRGPARWALLRRLLSAPIGQCRPIPAGMAAHPPAATVTVR